MDLVQWGTKKDGVFVFQQLLVIVNKDTTATPNTNPPYRGRVSGVWDGSSPGRATFSMNAIQKADERSYMCSLAPKRLGALPVFDLVRLLVVGKQTMVAFLLLSLNLPISLLSAAFYLFVFSFVG